jgi:branched-chain amino acid transport system substrate-binding protein
MRAMPVNDMYNDNVRIRPDGRVLLKMYLMQVKAPAESAYCDDVYTILSATPGEDTLCQQIVVFRELRPHSGC